MLEPIGVGPQAEAVYRTMLAHRDWTWRQISEHLGLPEPVVQSALDELAELSLLAPAEASVEALRPVNPALGLSSLLAQAEAEIEQRRQEIESARAAMASLAAEAADAASRDAFVRLDGVDAVREHMERMATSIEFECLSMNPVTSQSTSAKAASKSLNELLLNRGVQLRCIYQQSFSNNHQLVEYAEWLTSLGGVVRTAPIVPTMMIVYDRKGVLIPIDPANTQLGAIDVTGLGILTLACSLFEQMWNSSMPFGAATPRDDDGLNPTERQLLSLLCDGHTDEVAARRLGVSLSTVRRLMAGIMERLCARSRFQAGVRAAERGWLRPLASD
jgi:DNA-binding CsgD family transcriptional regulator/sugar-specific transcriptional regulator TrmB